MGTLQAGEWDSLTPHRPRGPQGRGLGMDEDERGIDSMMITDRLSLEWRWSPGIPGMWIDLGNRRHDRSLSIDLYSPWWCMGGEGSLTKWQGLKLWLGTWDTAIDDESDSPYWHRDWFFRLLGIGVRWTSRRIPDEER